MLSTLLDNRCLENRYSNHYLGKRELVPKIKLNFLILKNAIGLLYYKSQLNNITPNYLLLNFIIIRIFLTI